MPHSDIRFNLRGIIYFNLAEKDTPVTTKLPSNILITGGGRWVGLVKRMRLAMKTTRRFKNGKILIASTESLTPAGCFADGHFSVPAAKNPDFANALLHICEKNDVAAVIPTMDVDLKYLSSHHRMFRNAGIQLCMNDEPLCTLSLDKWAFYQFCKQESLNVPATFLNTETMEENLFPLFVKPRFGHGSQGTQIIESNGQLKHYAQNANEEFIIQPFIKAAEISVDTLVDKEGKIHVAVPRKRIKTLGGEAVKTTTINPGPVLELAENLLTKLVSKGFWGSANIQIFENDEPSIIEINARLGSASTLSDSATDGRFYGNLLKIAGDETLPAPDRTYKTGASLYRYFGDIYHEDNRLLEKPL